MIERKQMKFRLEDTDETGVFWGYAGRTSKDADNDVIQSGAYSKSIQEQGIFPLLWFHRPDTPVGKISELREDEQGLFVKGELDLDIQKGAEIFSGIRKGYLNSMSVGFNLVKSHMNGNVRHITEARLREVSIVTRNFAANSGALITDFKSLSDNLEFIQTLSADSDITPEQITATIKHLQALLPEPEESTPAAQPSDDTAELMKRLQVVWGRN